MTRPEDIANEERKLSQLAAAIRTRRNALGISQEALADAASVNRTHIGEVERGKRNVSFLLLIRIADALDLKLSELLSAARL